MPTIEIFIDSQTQGTNFLLEVTKGTNPTVRVYVFENGTAITLSATETATLVYAPNRESSSNITLDGTVTAGLAYIDFTFTEASLPTSGKFWSSIILSDTTAETNVVLSDGMLIIKKNPISN